MVWAGRDPNEVDRPLPDNLVGDVDLAATGIASPGHLHARECVLAPDAVQVFDPGKADL